MRDADRPLFHGLLSLAGSLSCTALVVAMLAVPVAEVRAAEQELCKALEQNAKASKDSGSKRDAAIRSLVGAPLPLGVECGSLGDVIARTMGGSKSGKLLEQRKQLDVPAAEAELKSAMDDADVTQKFSALQDAIADAPGRLLYEAAVLDAAGYYAARDLKILHFTESHQE